MLSQLAGNRGVEDIVGDGGCRRLFCSLTCNT